MRGCPGNGRQEEEERKIEKRYPGEIVGENIKPKKKKKKKISCIGKFTWVWVRFILC